MNLEKWLIRLPKQLNCFRRAITPLISTILLIGVTIIAGMLIAGAVFLTLNAPPNIVVDVSGATNFASSGTEYGKVNHMSLIIKNFGDEVVISPTKIIIHDNLDRALAGWRINDNRSEIRLTTNEVSYIPMRCISLTSELRVNSTFWVEIRNITIDEPPAGFKAVSYSSKPNYFKVGGYLGPFTLGTPIPSGTGIQVAITNNGTLTTDVTVEMSLQDIDKVYTNTSIITKQIVVRTSALYQFFVFKTNPANNVTTSILFRIIVGSATYSMNVIPFSI